MISVLLGGKFISFTFIVITDMFGLISTVFFWGGVPTYPAFSRLFSSFLIVCIFFILLSCRFESLTVFFILLAVPLKILTYPLEFV